MAIARRSNFWAVHIYSDNLRSTGHGQTPRPGVRRMIYGGQINRKYRAFREMQQFYSQDADDMR